jgi:hypothetical protein
MCHFYTCLWLCYVIQMDDVVKFPANLNRSKREFHDIAGFPNIIGAVDCTHVGLTNISKDIEHVYINRKR